MKGTNIFCRDCGKSEWWGSEETGSVVSECICEDKRVECDSCSHKFLPKDMSLNDMFLALCKLCNEHKRHLMDNMAVARLKEKARIPFTMLCVEEIGDMLQLTIRAYHLGISIVFPGMTKEAIVFRWLTSSAVEQVLESEILFDTAFLRLMSDYMTKVEVISYRRKMKDQASASLPPEGVFASSCTAWTTRESNPVCSPRS